MPGKRTEDAKASDIPLRKITGGAQALLKRKTIPLGLVYDPGGIWQCGRNIHYEVREYTTIASSSAGTGRWSGLRGIEDVPACSGS